MMNKSRWKELILYILAIVVAKLEFVGCYPLIPGFFCSGVYGRGQPHAASRIQYLWHGAVCAGAGNGKIYDGAACYGDCD